MLAESLNPRKARWDWLAERPILLVVAALAILLLLINPNWKTDPDSVSYLSMARSFASGTGMHRLGFQQLYYAPLYSVFISPVFWLKGSPFLRISIINVLTAWAFVIGTYCWLRKYSLRGAGLVAALVGVNIGLWDVCREPRADTLFSALLIWAAIFLAKAADSIGTRPFALNTLAGALLVIAACLTRQVGIFITAGFVVAIFIRWCRDRLSIQRIIVGVLLGLLATAVVSLMLARDRRAGKLDHLTGAQTYLDQYREVDSSFAAQVIDGFRRQTSDVGRLILPGMWGAFAHRGEWFSFITIFYVLFTVPMAIGWWHLARRTDDPLLWTVPFYAAMFVVWPFDQGTRFNVPMLPVLWASAWEMLRRWPGRRMMIFGIALALHFAAAVIYLVHDAAVVGRRDLIAEPMTQLVHKISTNAPVAALNISGTGRDIAMYVLDRPVITVEKQELASRHDIGWLVAPQPTSVPPGLEKVAETDGLKLYRRTSLKP